MTIATLRGARVLLTGASGGIGQVTARRLSREGAQLVLTGRRTDILDTLAAELEARAVTADLSRREEVDRLLEAAGEIDVLIANAATPATGRLQSLDQDRIDRAIEVNLRAPAALARGLAAGMAARGSGHLVFIGSLSGKAANAGSSVYNATKFGLRGFALALRDELAPAGIGVSLVAPGFVSQAGMFAETGVKLPRGLSTRTPEQVADAVVRAILEDRGEIEVAALTMRLGADIANLAPGLAARASRVIGGERLALELERQRRSGGA
ncbi:MAG: SDR family NAD(P)-dependent oxidoreductase [Solirubrobacteraceae bacterium]|jgi:short-subunit dehydrogenase